MIVLAWVLIALLALLIGYSYFIYPLTVALINRLKPRRQLVALDSQPTVTLLIAAHNEQAVIGDKLNNSLALDYPTDRLQVLVAADACTDATVEIVKSFQANHSHISLYEVIDHKGKINALNEAFPLIDSDFVVFSDANSMYDPDAIRRLLEPMGDPTVGVVCGSLHLTNPEQIAVGAGEGLYWRYETWLKGEESRFNSLIGANGSIYAIRRELYSPLRLDACDDFVTPMLIHRKGYRVLYQPKARCFEQTNETTSQAFWRKVRIILQELVTLRRYAAEIRPFSGVFGWQIISHKLLRWLVPVWMVAIFLLTFTIIGTTIGQLLMALQLVFYAVAGWGYWAQLKGRQLPPGMNIPFYFCLMNASALVAISRFVRGKSQPKWKVARSGS